MTVQGYAVVYVVFLVVLFAAVAWKTPILRDRGPLAPGVANGQQTFSLARSQLMWWVFTIAVVSGWLDIAAGSMLSPGLPVLGLFAISAGTAIVATVIDQPEPGGSAVPLARSRSWLHDVLDDGQGISVHRYQVLLANAGIALVFIYQSIAQVVFYTIDGMWVGLLAISSVLYLGLKSRESGVPRPAALTAAAPAPAAPVSGTAIPGASG